MKFREDHDSWIFERILVMMDSKCDRGNLEFVVERIFFNLAVEKFEKLEKIQITSRVLLFKYKFSFYNAKKGRKSHNSQSNLKKKDESLINPLRVYIYIYI